MTTESQHRGLPLTSHLFSVLVVGSILLALIVTQMAADLARERGVAAQHEQLNTLGLSVASRAAPLLESGDDLRLAVLATSTADLGGCRVLIVGEDSRVRLDTGLSLRDADLAIATQNGGVQRFLDDAGVWEVCAPALGYDGFAGEVRLRYAQPVPDAAAFSWRLFLIVLLCCLSLIALAAWICHTWNLRLRELAGYARRVAASGGRVGAGFESEYGPAAGAVGELVDAVARLVDASGTAARDAAQAVLRTGREVVHLLEQRGLVPVGHAERTRRYADLLASELGIDESQRRDLADAALLHDIGKAGVRHSALEKATGLDEDERASLRQHPQRGASLLSGVPGLTAVADIVGHQHERWDGGGFPDGLRGDRIPLLSRILQIATAYDLLTARSHYGPPMPWPDALDVVQGERGERFDPELLDVFEELIRRNPQPQPRGDRVVISTAGAIPYRAADESAPPDEETIPEDEDAILAFGLTELEVLGDEPEAGESQ